MTDIDRTTDDARTDDEGPKLPFAEGEPVRLTMTHPAENGVQLPFGALGVILSPIDAEGTRFEVEFTEFDGRPDPEDEEGPGRTFGHIPAHLLESNGLPPKQEQERDDEAAEAERREQAAQAEQGSREHH